MADEAKADIQIAELNLSGRVRNVLANSNINTLSELCIMTDAQLLRTPGFGRQALNEVRYMLHRRSPSGLNEEYILPTKRPGDEEYIMQLFIKYDYIEKIDFKFICDYFIEQGVTRENAYLCRDLKGINNIKGLPEPVYQIIRDAYRDIEEHTAPTQRFLDEEYTLSILMKYENIDSNEFDSICDYLIAREMPQETNILYRALKAINNVKGLPEPVYQIIGDAYRELPTGIPHLACP